MAFAKKLRKLTDGSKKAPGDELDCPICLESTKGVAFECSNGHLMCGICQQKAQLVKCPTCRDQNLQLLPSVKIFRRMCTFPCKNKEAGCQMIISEKLLKIHEKTCAYRTATCFVQNCSALMAEKDLKNHVMLEHNECVFGLMGKIPIKRLNMDPGALGLAVSKYYFSHSGRKYVFSVELQYGVCLRIYGKPLNKGAVSSNLRVEFWLEDNEVAYPVKQKSIASHGEEPNSDTTFVVPVELFSKEKYFLNHDCQLLICIKLTKYSKQQTNPGTQYDA